MESTALKMLPAWLEAELPPTRPLAVVKKSQQGFMVQHCSEASRGPFPTLAEAVDAFDEEVEGKSLVFDDSCGTPSFTGCLREGNRKFMSWTDFDALNMLEAAYREWNAIYDSWRGDKESFQKSFLMIERHPAFWLRCAEEKTFVWNTSAGVPLVSLTSKGEVTLSIGLHLAPAFRELSEDALEVTRASYEESIVALANLLDETCTSEGCLREGVCAPSQEWVYSLKERLRKATLHDTITT